MREMVSHVAIIAMLQNHNLPQAFEMDTPIHNKQVQDSTHCLTPSASCTSSFGSYVKRSIETVHMGGV